MLRRVPWLLWAGWLAPFVTVPGHAAGSAWKPAAPPPPIPFSRKMKPRYRLEVGDRWRVRASSYPMQMPEPAWQPPETWLFAVVGVEKTKEGPRLVVTATREGASRPVVSIYLDPDTRALTRVDSVLPAPGGERAMVERPTPGEPFVSELSPVPLAFAAAGAPDGSESAKTEAAAAEHPAAGHSAGAATGPAPLAFTFGRRLSERSEPVDAGVGRAEIERGMSALGLGLRARMEPDGVPRFVTTIEGPGLRVEQIWDETTPWPLYTETDSSRSWLVAYKKGK